MARAHVSHTDTHREASRYTTATDTRVRLGGFTKDLAVHIRLRRVGKTKAPTYRVVIADSRAPRNGKFIESIGHYNPRSEPADLVVNADRARHWIKNGARPTATARSLLVRSGLPEAEVPPAVR